MKAVTVEECASVQEAMDVAYQADDPVSIVDDQDECLVVMTPDVFERILFDSSLMNCLACQARDGAPAG